MFIDKYSTVRVRCLSPVRILHVSILSAIGILSGFSQDFWEKAVRCLSARPDKGETLLSGLPMSLTVGVCFKAWYTDCEAERPMQHEPFPIAYGPWTLSLPVFVCGKLIKLLKVSDKMSAVHAHPVTITSYIKMLNRILNYEFKTNSIVHLCTFVYKFIHYKCKWNGLEHFWNWNFDLLWFRLQFFTL